MAAALSYADPSYDALASAAEQKYGLPAGILNAIRTLGERSNANQVSPAGARTVYQFIPATRQGFIKNYGIDPWSGPEASTDAAAIHLRDDYKRTGSWNEAIARYNGGQHPNAAAYRYQAKVGDFDNSGANNMAVNPSLYPVVNGVDPLAPEPPQQPVPIGASAGPSVPVPSASPIAAKKRGGILGTLEDIFMPNPDSQWAGALRDGLTNAKESQQNYREQQQAKALDLATANVKLRRMIQQGEFTVVGNNVLHTKPDGTYEMISGPSSLDDKTKLIDLWNQRRDANPNDPTLPLLESIIEGSYANTPEAIAAKNATTIAAAKVRAGGTVTAARIRGPNAAVTNALPAVPPGWKVIH